MFKFLPNNKSEIEHSTSEIKHPTLFYLKLSQTHKLLHPCRHFLRRQVPDLFGAEFLHAERGQCRPENDRIFHVLEVYRTHLSHITHKPARKSVAGAGGV